MLNLTKSVALNGTSKINGADAMGFSAVIKSDKPDDITIRSWKTNEELYRENREECRKDYAEFEDAAYALREEMMKKISKESR